MKTEIPILKYDEVHEFEGYIESVSKQCCSYNHSQYQIHLNLRPTNIKIANMTGTIDVYLRIPSRYEEEKKLSELSVLYRYIKEIIRIFPELSDEEDIMKIFESLKGKRLFFRRLILGSDFKDNKARGYLTPLRGLE